MRKNIEKLIPIAIKVVEKELEVEIDKKVKDKDKETYTMQRVKVVPSQYNGYISSLGAGLVQAGLLPTLAFYSNLQSKSEQDRLKLLKAIYRVIENQMEGELKGDELLKKAIEIQGNTSEMYLLKTQIRNAAVAIKLAIRTFELDKSVQKGEA